MSGSCAPQVAFLGMEAGMAISRSGLGPEGGRRALLAPALGLAAALALAGCATQAPATRQDMLARGAERLQWGELNAMLPGARIVMTGNTGIPVAWTNREDGSLTAVPERVGLFSWIGRGRWWLTPGAAFCTEIDWQSTTGSEGKPRICWHLYRLGAVHYGVQADGRPTPVDLFSIRAGPTPSRAAPSGPTAP